MALSTVVKHKGASASAEEDSLSLRGAPSQKDVLVVIVVLLTVPETALDAKISDDVTVHRWCILSRLTKC